MIKETAVTVIEEILGFNQWWLLSSQGSTPHVFFFSPNPPNMYEDKENLAPEIVAVPEKKLSGGAQPGGIPSWSEYLKMMEAEGEASPTPAEEAPVCIAALPLLTVSEATTKKSKTSNEATHRRRENEATKDACRG